MGLGHPVFKIIRCFFGIHVFETVKAISNTFNKVQCIDCGKCYAKVHDSNIKLPYNRYYHWLEQMDDQLKNLKQSPNNMPKNYKQYSEK